MFGGGQVVMVDTLGIKCPLPKWTNGNISPGQNRELRNVEYGWISTPAGEGGQMVLILGIKRVTYADNIF